MIPNPKQPCPCTLLDLNEASSYLKMPKSTIYKKTSARQIPHLKPGKRLMFCQEHLQQWIMEFYQMTTTDKLI